MVCTWEKLFALFFVNLPKKECCSKGLTLKHCLKKEVLSPRMYLRSKGKHYVSLPVCNHRLVDLT